MVKPAISASSITKNTLIDSSSLQTLNNINKVISPQNGIKIVKIGYHKNGKANFVKVLNENMIISGGDENIIFYDSGYNNKKEISIKNDNIFKIKENKKNNNMEIIICSDKVDKINLLTIPNNISNLNDY